MFGNHKPVLKGTDEGVKRRIRIVPFIVTIPPEERLPMSQLLATFRKEASGILNWALGGYMRWWEEGLGMSDAVRSAIDEYFDDNDIMQTFIDENCVVGPHYTSTNAKQLYGRYHYWCDSNGIRSLSSKGFYRMLAEKGFEKRIGTGNKSVFDGIALNDDEYEPAG